MNIGAISNSIGQMLNAADQTNKLATKSSMSTVNANSPKQNTASSAVATNTPTAQANTATKVAPGKNAELGAPQPTQSAERAARPVQNAQGQTTGKIINITA